MLLLYMDVNMRTGQTIKVTLFSDRDLNQLADGNKIHYAQHGHLEVVPIVSYHKNLFALFHVIQADVQGESE